MKAEVVGIETFIESPGPGIAAHGSTYYVRRDGVELVSIHGWQSQSDKTDVTYVRRSEDNGRTWDEAVEHRTHFDHPDGTLRRSPRGGYVDPATNRYITIGNEAVLPTDNPLEGMRQWYLTYTVSEDGGRTTIAEGQIVHEGEAYDETHFMPNVWKGRNCVMLGDLGQRPLTRSDGTILVPVQSSPVGPDGVYFNPAGTGTWTDAMLLFGRWRPDGSLAWTCSERVSATPDQTTRGLIEPTIAELSDGTLIMVMRGSNDRKPELPGYRWIARSTDGGETWSDAEPWTYDDGTPFYSPSSMSQLVPWTDGRLLWLGNLCEANPYGNSPRYPLVAAEVDLQSGKLIRDTVTPIDDRKPDESERLTLSNFYARPDRETGELLLHLSRYFAHDFRVNNTVDWTADALLYRVRIG